MCECAQRKLKILGADKRTDDVTSAAHGYRPLQHGPNKMDRYRYRPELESDTAVIKPGSGYRRLSASITCDIIFQKITKLDSADV